MELEGTTARNAEAASAALKELEILESQAAFDASPVESPQDFAGPQNSLDFEDIPHEEHEVLSPGTRDTDALIQRATPADGGSFYSISYYQRFFDVTTRQVVKRLFRAVVPSKEPFFTPEDPKPDLYGPFWVTTTLIFVMACTGNLAGYYSGSGERWKFDKVTTSATVLYSAIFILPLVVYFWLRHIRCPRGFIEIVAIYGYSLTIFIPACLLCVFNSEIWRWLLVIVAYSGSVHFLLLNLWKNSNYREHHNHGELSARLALAGVMLFFHLIIAIVMKVYFFEHSSAPTAPPAS